MNNVVTLPAPTTPVAPVYVAPARPDTDSMPLMRLDDLPQNMFWQVLGRALTWRREYGTKTEAAYVAWLVNRLPVSMIDCAGNIHVDTRTAPHHRTMFTSHTDTVHHGGGVNNVHVDDKFWRAGKGHALGADDGAGNAIMAHMIERGVPGYYIFFRGEECGGVGSKWLAEEMPHVFDDIDHAVAFDRADYYDVITHQGGTRCCSDEFAEALATELSTDEHWMTPCNGGVYTDTAEFIETVPECTNISVGYKHQHGDREYQDVEFLWDLAQRMIHVNWSELPVKRDPKVYESLYTRAPRRKGAAKGSASAYGVYMGLGPMSDLEEEDYWDAWDRSGVEPSDPVGAVGPMAEADLELLDALENAIDYCLFGPLMTMVATHVYPANPNLAHQNMRMVDINDDVLMSALEMVDAGWDTAVVLQEIYDACAIA